MAEIRRSGNRRWKKTALCFSGNPAQRLRVSLEVRKSTWRWSSMRSLLRLCKLSQRGRYLLLVRWLLEVLPADVDDLILSQSQGPGHAGARCVRRVRMLGEHSVIS